MKKINLPTLSVGIPAFNEERNIAKLVNALLNQKYKSISLKKIIVVSDASTDNTVSLLKKIKDKRIRVLVNKKRIGAQSTQNRIIKNTNTDILVLLDADVLPKNRNMIEKLSKPILDNSKVGLVGGLTVPAKPKTFTEKVLVQNHTFKYLLYAKIRGGNNLFMCHGRVRAFSKKLYKKIIWPSRGPEDAMSYLFCTMNSLEFRFVKNASVVFRIPATVGDHEKQSVRFSKDLTLTKNIFGKQLVNDELQLDLSSIVHAIFAYILSHPILFFSYILIMLRIKLFSEKNNVNLSKWEIALSSKNI